MALPKIGQPYVRLGHALSELTNMCQHPMSANARQIAEFEISANAILMSSKQMSTNIAEFEMSPNVVQMLSKQMSSKKAGLIT
jgi:hypothetical protein